MYLSKCSLKTTSDAIKAPNSIDKSIAKKAVLNAFLYNMNEYLISRRTLKFTHNR